MQENRRIWLLGGTVVVMALVVIGGFLLFRGGPEHKLTVTSIPNDLTLTLDGTPIGANGDVQVKQGRHTLTGERRGFESHSVTVDISQDSTLRMYLYSNNAEGRAWEQNHPNEELEAEAEAGRRYQELNDRQQARYPILQELPYIGPGFTINYGKSKQHPDDPESLAFYIKVTDSEGKKKALEYLTGHGFEPADLELIYTS
jgi:hypothetical protein